MIRRLSFISLTAALSVLVSPAEESCPWLNAATAAGILGHSVTASVTHPGKDKNDAVCEFTGDAAGLSILRIEVETMANPPVDFPFWLAQCGSKGTPVRGVGNLAVACLAEKDGNISEQIISRVRNRALLIRITARKSVTLRPPLREQAQTAAELVAGSLF